MSCTAHRPPPEPDHGLGGASPPVHCPPTNSSWRRARYEEGDVAPHTPPTDHGAEVPSVRRATLERRVDCHGRQVTRAVQIDQLSPFAGPHRCHAAATRHLPSRVRASRIRPHVDLGLPRLLRLVRQEAPIGRESRFAHILLIRRFGGHLQPFARPGIHASRGVKPDFSSSKRSPGGKVLPCRNEFPVRCPGGGIEQAKRFLADLAQADRSPTESLRA